MTQYGMPCLALGGLAHEALAVGEGNDRRGGACALGVLDDARLGALHHGNAGVGGAQVNADDRAADVITVPRGGEQRRNCVL